MDFTIDIPLGQLTASGLAGDWGDLNKGHYATLALGNSMNQGFVGYWGNHPIGTAAHTYDVTVIPEPGGAAIALAAIGGFIIARRRRQPAQAR